MELYNRDIYHTALMTNSKAKFDSNSAWCRGIISLWVHTAAALQLCAISELSNPLKEHEAV